MTKEQIAHLRLGISPIDDRTALIIESGLEWVLANTTLVFDMHREEDLEALPACVKLFLSKFFDIQMLGTGVSSESIEGLSQSFDSSDKSDLLWQFAQELLAPYLKSSVRFISAKRRWK